MVEETTEDEPKKKVSQAELKKQLEEYSLQKITPAEYATFNRRQRRAYAARMRKLGKRGPDR